MLLQMSKIWLYLACSSFHFSHLDAFEFIQSKVGKIYLDASIVPDNALSKSFTSDATSVLTNLSSTAKMIPLFMMFAGGPLGSGKQWYLLCPQRHN